MGPSQGQLNGERVSLTIKCNHEILELVPVRGYNHRLSTRPGLRQLDAKLVLYETRRALRSLYFRNPVRVAKRLYGADPGLSISKWRVILLGVPFFDDCLERQVTKSVHLVGDGGERGSQTPRARDPAQESTSHSLRG